ncbi:MAG: hypothetical protein NVS2B17_15590 [Candidatus Velthaea sp.]
MRGAIVYDQPVEFNLNAVIWKIEFWAVGIFVLLKGRSRAAVALAVMALGFGVGGNVAWFSAVPIGFRLGILFLTTISFMAAFAGLFLFFKDTFGHPGAGKTARRLETASWSTLVAYLVFNLSQILSDWLFGWQDARLTHISNILNLLVFSLWLLYSAVLYSSARRERRPGVNWVFWMTIVGLSGPLASSVANLVGYDNRIVVFLRDATPLVMSPAYVYSIFKYRAVDVAIGLNRAIVAAVVTLVFLGIVTIAESEIERFAINATKFETAALKLAVPFALGIAFTPLHRLTEKFTERLIFRRKREAELALAALRLDVAEDDAPHDVIVRTLRRLRSIFRFSTLAVYVQNGNELHRLACEGPPEALPQKLTNAATTGSDRLDIVMRGRRIGAMCWICPDGDLISAQETHVLREIAHEVGVEMSFRAART